MGGAYNAHEGDENAYTILVGKPERKEPLGRPRCRWEVYTKIDRKELGWRVWIGFI
jgi:hypothetical protein